MRSLCSPVATNAQLPSKPHPGPSERATPAHVHPGDVVAHLATVLARGGVVVVPAGEVGPQRVEHPAAERDPGHVSGPPPHRVAAVTASGAAPPPRARLVRVADRQSVGSA